jgi:hypothetical protein
MADPSAEVRVDPGSSRTVVSPLHSVAMRRSLAVGVVSAAISFGLRHAGLLVGPWAIAIGVLCFVFAPGPRRLAERTLLSFALAVGFLPLAGWVPGLERHLDVPGVFLSIAVGVVCGYQVLGSTTGSRTVEVPSPNEVVALVASGAVAWWWARPWGRLSTSGTLYQLFRGYDNNSHFGIFQENLQLGSFIQVRPTLPGGADRLGYDYPQGMHQSWAQFVRLLVPHPPTAVPWLLNAYLDMLLLTCGGVVLVGCMAVARLCRRDLLIAAPAMAVVVALFAFGRFEPFTGFMSYELAVAACAVAVTLMVRPSMGPTTNFFAVAGMGLIVVYNWYPLLVLAAPAIVIAALRARSGSLGWARRVMVGVVVLTAVAYVLPAVFFLHRGVSTLNVAGSGISTSWGLLLAAVVGLVTVVLFRQASHRDLTTNLIVGAPAVLGAGAVIVLACFEYGSVGYVAHYGQKFALGVLGVCLVVLSCLVAGDLAARGRRRLPLPIAAGLTVLLAAAALQVDGYVGPLTGVLKSGDDAMGITVQHQVQVADAHSVEAEQVVLAAQHARAAGAGVVPGQWWYVGVEPTTYAPTRTDFVRLSLWFAVLADDSSNQGYFESQSLGKQLTLVHSPSVTARIVIDDFPSPLKDHVHLFVPSWLETAIVAQDPTWSTPGLLEVIPSVGS